MIKKRKPLRGGHRKAVNQYTLEGKLVKRFSYIDLTKKDGFSPTKVSACCLGKAPTHKGFTFKYVDPKNMKPKPPKYVWGSE